MTKVLPLFLLLLLTTTHSFTSMPRRRRQKSATTTTTQIALKPVASISTDASSSSSNVNNKKESAPAPSSSSSNRNNWKLPSILPKVIIFDLDNTLWTPELYQIRGQRQCPTPGKQIRLFPDVDKILQLLQQKDVTLAIASRTNKIDWAWQLLEEFTVVGDGTTLDQIFTQVEIRTGSKKTHMANLRQSTGASYQEMVFFDDDVHLNLREISQMGMLCGHCPKGMTMDVFTKTMDRYADLQSKDGSWMGEIVKAHIEAEGKVTTGVVDFYNPAKRFGFVKADGEKFFFHESKVAAGLTVKKGMRVSIETMTDGKGRLACAVLGTSSGAATTTPQSNNNNNNKDQTMTMPCFTMSQPFASLLVHGIKTVESRNNDMFASLPEGTKILVHAGRKDWRDTESYKEILRGSMNDSEIAKLSKIPKGFSKGQILGMCTLGKTTKTASPRERSQLQRQVCAPTDGIGVYCTEILDAQWLPRGGIPMRGQPGIYEVTVPKAALGNNDNNKD